jgi:hypothetical protein
MKHNSKINNRWLRNFANMLASRFIRGSMTQWFNVIPSCDADFDDRARR